MSLDAAVREHLAKMLAWEDAHAAYDKVVDDIPPSHRGTRPPGLPHSAWELVEHLRITQHDILDFCRNPEYRELDWPVDYWPGSPEPTPSGNAWDDSIRQYSADRRALQALAADPGVDLVARIPHGSGQTIMRELILVADHTAYHVGQLVLVRRALGVWE